MTTVTVTPTSRTVVQIDRNIIGPQGPTGDVNPEMYVILADTELARDEAQSSATSALASANTATAQAVISTDASSVSTTQAGIATTQAGLASTSASTAATQAGISTTQAGLASTFASNALTSENTAITQAGIAITQAGIATTQAGLSATSASEALTSANTATTQAGIATTQAGIATTQAGIATTQAGLASTSASEALASELSATASAETAVNAPGTSGTSTTSLAIGLGSKTFTTQTAKDWGIGQFVVIAVTTDVESFMFGQISAYDLGTGSMTVLVTATGLLGTYANWTISLAPAVVSTTVVQTDIGTDPNQIPLNQFLGSLAYQEKESFVIAPVASVVPAIIGEMVFQLTNDTTLVIKVKGSDGVVRSNTLTLA